MKIEIGQQAEAQSKIQHLLQNAEDARKIKRVKRGIAALCLGDYNLLYNEELARQLPSHLAETIDDNNAHHLGQLLGALRLAALADDVQMRERAAMILSLAGESLVSSEMDESVLLFSSILIEWLAIEAVFIAGYEMLCCQLNRLAVLLIKKRNWQTAEYLLKTLHEIETGKLKKNRVIKSIVVKMRCNIANQEILDLVYSCFLDELVEPLQAMENVLIYLGKLSVSHALNLLKESENRYERDLLIQLLATGGRSAVEVIDEKLKADEPWFMLRNMIQILCSMRDASLYPIIEKKLQNDDLRVQREVLRCIFRTGGSVKTSRLMRALHLVDDSLKISIIKELGKSKEPGIAKALRSLLEKSLMNVECASEQLLYAVAHALQKYPDNKNIKTLGRVAVELQQGQQNNTLLLCIEDARNMLATELRRKSHRNVSESDISFDEDPVATEKAKRKTRSIEEQVEDLLAGRQTKQAGELLFAKCVEYAQEKDFATAERLRDRIFEVNPAGVSLVVEAEEIIERERKSKIPASCLKLWDDLKNVLGPRIFENLYAASEKESYLAGELIARQGERDGRLYFVDQGNISLTCTTGSSETFLRRLQAGAVVGRDQFFNVSVWTVTVQATSPLELRVVTRESLTELELKFPGIEETLHEYCLGSNYIPDLLKMSGEDRRNSVRYPMSTKIQIQLFNAYGIAGQRPFISLLQDISQGGFSFSIGISSKANARLLLGRKIHAGFEVAAGDSVALDGIIVGVLRNKMQQGSYRVNVKMLQHLPETVLKPIVSRLNIK